MDKNRLTYAQYIQKFNVPKIKNNYGYWLIRRAEQYESCRLAKNPIYRKYM